MSDEPKDAPAVAFPGARLRSSAGPRVANVMVGALAAVMAVLVAAVPDLRLPMATLAAVLAGPLAFALWHLHKHTPAGGGAIVVQSDGVHVDGKLALPRGSIERAVVAPDEARVNVALERRQGFTSVIDVTSLEQGHALVGALGLAATQALSSFRFDSPIGTHFAGWRQLLVIAALFVCVPLPLLLGLGWLALVLGVGWYGFLFAMVAPSVLTVGLDGVLVQWGWRRELIAFADVKAVERDGERLRLELTDGTRRMLGTHLGAYGKRGDKPEAFASRAAYVDAVVARVREAMAASQSLAGRLPAEALIRQGRPVNAWAASLRALVARGAAGFRGAETLPEQLWVTVQDAGADPELRAAAAVALGPTLAETDRERLRAVARVVVAPRLRIALEAVAQDDSDGVEEALAALGEPRPTARAGRSG